MFSKHQTDNSKDGTVSRMDPSHHETELTQIIQSKLFTSAVLNPILAERHSNLLLIYHNQDCRCVNDELTPILQKEGINCLDMEEHGEPGKPKFHNFETLVQETGRVLFIVSKHFQASRFLSMLPLAAKERVPYENVFCLLLDDSIRFEDDLSCLSAVRTVQWNSGNWRNELIDRLRFRRPAFSHVLDPSCVSHSLQSHGLDIRHLKFTMYGIIVELSNVTVRIDVDEYLNHQEKHDALDISQICGECSMLRTPQTIVSLVFNNKELSNTTKTRKFEDMFVELCGKILDVTTPREAKVPYTAGCTIRGRPHDPSYIKRLWCKVYYVSLNHHKGTIRFPALAEEEARYASYPDNWQTDKVPRIEDLVKAGFFYSADLQQTACFACGTCIVNWRKDSDIWYEHASQAFQCSVVKANLSSDDIGKAVASLIEQKYHENEEFSNIESRKESFKSFDLTKMVPGKMEDFDRDELVDELAVAGFYYVGISDIFTCYACGLTLTYLTPDMSIMATHATVSPTCPHLLRVKDKDYIRDISRTAAHESMFTVVSFKLKLLDSKPVDHGYMFLYSAC